MAANAKPLILYDNRLLDGTPAATDTESGYNVLNLVDYRTYTQWKAASAGTKYITVDCGSAKSADCLAIVGHNLYTAGAVVSVENSEDNIHWAERLAGFTPASDKAFLKQMTQGVGHAPVVSWDSEVEFDPEVEWETIEVPAAARYWRIKIVTAAIAPYMAVVMLGNGMSFERYAQAFDPFPEQISAKSERSKTGNLLGNSLKYITSNIEVQWIYLTDNWVKNTFQAAWDAHLSLLKPFFWAWEPTNHASEVHYVKIPDSFSLSKPFDPIRRSLSLTFETVKEI
jgi:hypothetical protein